MKASKQTGVKNKKKNLSTGNMKPQNESKPAFGHMLQQT